MLPVLLGGLYLPLVPMGTGKGASWDTQNSFSFPLCCSSGDDEDDDVQFTQLAEADFLIPDGDC